ncbi:Protein STIP1 homolog, partial [Durusdinium trenchii]
ALRGHELGLAVACYTTGLALLPPEAVAAVPDGVAPEDEHALLRSVLFSNRASVFCRLKTWRSARADAQAAVEKKGDFVKARNRLGTALLACGQVEQAYVHFAHALKLESNNTAALKGRQACISILPLWRTLPARRRFRERFGVDLWRPKGTSKVNMSFWAFLLWPAPPLPILN